MKNQTRKGVSKRHADEDEDSAYSKQSCADYDCDEFLDASELENKNLTVWYKIKGGTGVSRQPE